jgi:hypothetical protein
MFFVVDSLCLLSLVISYFFVVDVVGLSSSRLQPSASSRDPDLRKRGRPARENAYARTGSGIYGMGVTMATGKES